MNIEELQVLHYLVSHSHPDKIVQAALSIGGPSSFRQLVAHHLQTKEGGLDNPLDLLLLLLLLLRQGGAESKAHLNPWPPNVATSEGLDIVGVSRRL